MSGDLFDVGPRRPERAKDTCTPARPGTGPEGETCGSCRFLAAVGGHSRNYYKCGLMREHWTRGGASDIKLKWDACRAWEKKDA